MALRNTPLHVGAALVDAGLSISAAERVVRDAEFQDVVQVDYLQNIASDRRLGADAARESAERLDREAAAIDHVAARIQGSDMPAMMSGVDERVSSRWLSDTESYFASRGLGEDPARYVAMLVAANHGSLADRIAAAESGRAALNAYLTDARRFQAAHPELAEPESHLPKLRPNL
ncbi:MAG: hypothetical protein ABSD03_14240 [Vulcanimicrobiaceae bacterium]|jgi:hypothetical protein